MQDLKNVLVSEESGQGLVEYALIISLVAIGLVTGLIALRGRIGDVFTAIQNAMPTTP